MPPFLTAWLIDVVSENPPLWLSYIGITDTWNAVLFIMAVTAVVFLLESFFEWRYKILFMNLAQEIQNVIRVRAYDNLQKKNMQFFSKMRTGNLISILNDDINQLERFLNTSFNEIIQMILLVLVAGLSLCQQSLCLGIIGMLPIPFIIYGSFFYQKGVAPLYKQLRNTVGELSNRLENNISGIKLIKSYATEKYEMERVQGASIAYKNANHEAIKWNALYIPIIRIFVTVGFVSTLLIGSYWVMNDMNGFTYGTLAFFAMMIQRLLWPITSLGRISDEYERARAASARVFGLIDNSESLKYGSYKPDKDAEPPEIKFDHIHFAYKESLPVFQNFSLNIASGECIGIVGPSGAGKTTLIQLLMRFYDPDLGSIELGGVDIKEYDLPSLRNTISYVSQDVYLFHGTIRENIIYGCIGISEAEINEVLRQTRLATFVESLPEGLETIVGEKGIRLSGGQKQRISLSRALLRRSTILILDEATSAVDTETEYILKKHLSSLMRNRTCIIIAHRLSTVMDLDRILFIEEGKVLEEGSQKELIALNQRYASLWHHQS